MPETQWTADDIDVEDEPGGVVVTILSTGDQYHLGQVEFDAECKQAGDTLQEGGSDVRWEVAARMSYRMAKQSADPAAPAKVSTSDPIPLKPPSPPEGGAS